MHRILLLVPFCALSLPSAAQQTPDILVSSRFTDEVLRYDGETGAFLGVFASGGGLDNPVGLTFGPDGDLYVASGDNNRVLEYDGATGAFVRVVAQNGALQAPRNLNFGPDGHLYVASGGSNEILRYDGTSGAFLGVFASGGQLRGPTSFTFGPGGDLFVGSVLTNRVKRYDGETGAYLGNFVTQNLNAPHDVAFAPDGRLVVTNAGQTRIRTYDGTTGAFLGNLVNDPSLSVPLGMQWDGVGHFYVANQGADEIRRYDAETGAFELAIVSPGSGGLDGPLFLTFVPPAGGPLIEPVWPGTAGTTNYLRYAGFVPGSRAFLVTGAPAVPIPLPGCGGVTFELALPVVLQTVLTDESGAGILGGVVPLELAGVTLQVQAIGPSTCRVSQRVGVTF